VQNSTNPPSRDSSSARLDAFATRLGQLLELSPFALRVAGDPAAAGAADAVPAGCRWFAIMPRAYDLLTVEDVGYRRLALIRDLLSDYLALHGEHAAQTVQNAQLHREVQLVTQINKELADDLTGIEDAFAPLAAGQMNYAVLHDQAVLLNAGLQRQTLEVCQRRLLQSREFSVMVGHGELFGVRSEGLAGIFESAQPLTDVTRDLLRMKIHWLGMQSRQRRLVDGLLELRNVYQSNMGEVSLLPGGQVLDDPKLNDHYRSLQERFHTLLQQAITDSLTTAFNRNKLNEALATLTANPGNRFSIILFDLDHFKCINDRFGHQEGDRVLVECVQVTRRVLRKNDLLARWGGEEFLVVLDDTALAPAVSRADHLRDQIAQHRFFPDHNVTCSYGVAERVPGESPEELVARADAALYCAKREGRNRVIASMADGSTDPGFLRARAA
jgi:diguanylate cyclase (GGDEF)-like protein